MKRSRRSVAAIAASAAVVAGLGVAAAPSQADTPQSYTATSRTWTFKP